MRRAERLFQIIQILRRSRSPVTGAALADELEVSTRTVYRDVADLMAQRVPIMGEAGLGYLLAAEYDMPPLMLTPAELEAIVLGAQWVAGRDDPLLSPAARDVLAKIVTAVPAHLRPFVAEPSTGVAPRLATVEEVVDAGILLLDELNAMPVLPLHLPFPQDDRLRRICGLLTDAPDQDLTARQWAAGVGVTERTLQRRFLNETGLTFGRWRQQARLLFALERLARGDRIIDVAMDSGYTSQSAFTAMFRRHFGAPPSRFYG